MFENFGWGEIAVILVIGLFVFGPERLPRVIADGVRLLRKLRAQAANLTDDLKAELDPHIGEFRREVDDLRRLDPSEELQDPLGPDRSRGAGSRTGTSSVAAPRAPRLRRGETPPYDPDAT